MAVNVVVTFLKGLPYLLQRLLRGVEFLPMMIQAGVQIPNLFPLHLYLVCENTYLDRGETLVLIRHRSFNMILRNIDCLVKYVRKLICTQI